MPTSNSVKKDQDEILAEIVGTPGWKVERTSKHIRIKNPQGISITTSATPGQQQVITILKQQLKDVLGWDADKLRRDRVEKRQAALIAAREKEAKQNEAAVREAQARHAKAMEQFKADAAPGTRIPGEGGIVAFKNGPRLYTRADALAALELLKDCDCNERPIGEANVRRLRAFQENGEWEYLPDGISLCIHGAPGNGKHRLLALTGADDAKLREHAEDPTKPAYEMSNGEPGLWFHVTYGVVQRKLDYFDNGKTRSIGDVLVHHGIVTKQDAGAVGTAQTMLTCYYRGVRWRSWGREIITTKQRLESLDEGGMFADLPTDKIMRDAKALHRSAMKMTLSSALAFVFIARRALDEETWKAFLQPLLTDVGYEPKDPRPSFRNNLIGKGDHVGEARRGIRELGMALKTLIKWLNRDTQQLATFRITEEMPELTKAERKPEVKQLQVEFDDAAV